MFVGVVMLEYFGQGDKNCRSIVTDSERWHNVAFLGITLAYRSRRRFEERYRQDKSGEN